MDKKQINRTSFKHLHEKGEDHMKRFMRADRNYKRSRMRLTVIELVVYLTLGLLLAMAWTAYPVFVQPR